MCNESKISFPSSILDSGTCYVGLLRPSESVGTLSWPFAFVSLRTSQKVSAPGFLDDHIRQLRNSPHNGEMTTPNAPHPEQDDFMQIATHIETVDERTLEKHFNTSADLEARFHAKLVSLVVYWTPLLCSASFPSFRANFSKRKVAFIKQMKKRLSTMLQGNFLSLLLRL